MKSDGKRDSVIPQEGSLVFVVTGGNGYIGSHMCRYLTSLGHTVHIIDNASSSPYPWVHSYGIFHRLDIGDGKKVTDLLLSLGKVDGIFHFAAKCVVMEGEQDPLLYYRENVQKTLSLIDSCIQGGVRNLIFSSTCAVFGLPQTEKITEEHPQNPINTYGNTKKLIELMMRDLSEKNLMKVIVFRYFNACGSAPDGSLGENHWPETHLIPNLCRSYLSGGVENFHIYGHNYPTPDGTCIRDYIHVEDLVRAHYLGYQHLSGLKEDQKGFLDFNLGSEKGYSVREVLQVFEELVGKKIPLELSSARPGDPARLVADSGKVKKILGLNCEYDLRDAIAHTLNWFKKNPASTMDHSQRGNQ